MAEVNAFNHGVATLTAAGAGLVAMFAVFLVDPFGPGVVLLSWLFVIAGIAIAIAPGRARPLGPGLLFAGAALPITVAVWLWLAYTGSVLFGGTWLE